MAGWDRRRIGNVVVGLAAGAAVRWAALKVLLTVALTSDTLDGLMDGCAAVVVEGRTSAMPGHWLWSTGNGMRGATVAIAEGSVPVRIETDYRDGSVHSCAIWGRVWDRDATVRNPAFPCRRRGHRSWPGLRGGRRSQATGGSSACSRAPTPPVLRPARDRGKGSACRHFQAILARRPRACARATVRRCFWQF